MPVNLIRLLLRIGTVPSPRAIDHWREIHQNPFQTNCATLMLSLLALLLFFFFFLPAHQRMASGEQNHLKYHCKKMYMGKEASEYREVLDVKKDIMCFFKKRKRKNRDRTTLLIQRLFL